MYRGQASYMLYGQQNGEIMHIILADIAWFVGALMSYMVC